MEIIAMLTLTVIALWILTLEEEIEDPPYIIKWTGVVTKREVFYEGDGEYAYMVWVTCAFNVERIIFVNTREEFRALRLGKRVTIKYSKRNKYKIRHFLFSDVVKKTTLPSEVILLYYEIQKD